MEANQGMMHSVIARHPMQMIMTVMGIVLFPFMGRGIFQHS
jgi:hypothetical protein